MDPIQNADPIFPVPATPYPVQPPVDNAHVAPGCTPFDARDLPTETANFALTNVQRIKAAYAMMDGLTIEGLPVDAYQSAATAWASLQEALKVLGRTPEGDGWMLP